MNKDLMKTTKDNKTKMKKDLKKKDLKLLMKAFPIYYNNMFPKKFAP